MLKANAILTNLDKTANIYITVIPLPDVNSKTPVDKVHMILQQSSPDPALQKAYEKLCKEFHELPDKIRMLKRL